MTLDALIIFVGAVVAALPFLGFPHMWLQVLLFVAGSTVVILGIIVRRRQHQKGQASQLPFDERV